MISVWEPRLTGSRARWQCIGSAFQMLQDTVWPAGHALIHQIFHQLTNMSWAHTLPGTIPGKNDVALIRTRWCVSSQREYDDQQWTVCPTNVHGGWSLAPGSQALTEHWSLWNLAYAFQTCARTASLGHPIQGIWYTEWGVHCSPYGAALFLWNKYSQHENWNFISLKTSLYCSLDMRREIGSGKKKDYIYSWENQDKLLL